MAKYIKRKTLITLIENLDWYSDEFGKLNQGATCEDKAYLRYNDVMDAIKQIENMAPTIIDVVPVVHGKWIPVTNGRGGNECNLCHAYAPSYQSGAEYNSPYCPNCGTKMNGGADNG